MIRGKKIYLHCPDGQRSVLEQRCRDLGASLADTPQMAGVIYVVGQSATAEEIAFYEKLEKPILYVNEDLIDRDLVDKLLSGKIRLRDADRDR